jgi:hypothetical protein
MDTIDLEEFSKEIMGKNNHGNPFFEGYSSAEMHSIF